MAHHIDYRVYYEDTDAGGVVYYANYLKFAERARTELLRENNINQTELADKEGLYFVVRHAELDLIKPAKLDDIITIETSIEEIRSASIKMRQHLHCGDILLAIIHVKIACVNKDFTPTRLSETIKKAFI